MAGPKKRVKDEDDQGASSDSGSEAPDLIDGSQMIEAEFEGRNPDGRDFDGVKTLLQQLFLKAHVNLSQLSDLLIEQNNVGSVLKQCNDDEEDEDDADDEELYNTDDDVFGITTVLNITHNKEANCIQELRSLLIELTEKHADEQTNNTIRNILGNDAKPVGLIINERFINIPAQICVPLFDSLINEINRANNKKNSQFNFAYYVLICKAFREESKKSSNENLNTNEIQFTNAEEEIFDKEAELKFEFCVKNESDSGVSGSWEEDDKVLIPYRRILLFPAQKLPSILGQIKEFVTTP